MRVEIAKKLGKGARLIWFPKGFMDFAACKTVHLIEFVNVPVDLSPRGQKGIYLAKVTETVTRPPWVDANALIVNIVQLFPWSHDAWRRIRQNVAERARLVVELEALQESPPADLTKRAKTEQPKSRIEIASGPRYDLFFDTRSALRKREVYGEYPNGKLDNRVSEDDIPF